MISGAYWSEGKRVTYSIVPEVRPDLTLPPDARPEHGDVGTRYVEAAVRTGPAEFWVLGSFAWVEHDA
ncbi:hypothetical protein [Nonomuraea sp. B19D2]|uniref:hypothetical protein n=1 Tax=Nonomuraea sp. B19D2 TaxID=3159561 RepID=UPI0032DB184D